MEELSFEIVDQQQENFNIQEVQTINFETPENEENIEFEIGELQETNFSIDDIEEMDFDLPNMGVVVYNDYEQLINLPKINNALVKGNKNGNELDLVNASSFLTNMEIEDILNRQI